MIKFANDSSIQLTATTTATSLKDLLIASGESAEKVFMKEASYGKIQAEGGDIRVCESGNVPTTAKGFLVTDGQLYIFSGTPIENIYVISTSGSVTFNVNIKVASQALT